MTSLADLKHLWIFRFLRRFKFLIKVYHYLWAVFGVFRYWFPSNKIFVIGITGTKGKTTVVETLSNILRANGEKIAVMSSLYFRIGNDQEKNLTDNTMPGRMFIQKLLKRAVDAGCKYALVEVTSEGVELSRHRFINWRVAVLNNLAPEHIESHGSFEKYRQAKLNFLKYAFSKGAQIFLNSDDSSAEFFKSQFENKKGRIKFYSQRDLTKLFSSIDNNNYLFSSDFNRENLAAAAVVAKSLNVSDEVIVTASLKFSGVPGRMEFIQQDPFWVVVDYAHTPASLEKVYSNLKKLARGKLICVLGSAGGGRDKWKRAKMGFIAEHFCSEIILTSEDPYDEDPKKILEDIKAGIGKKRAVEILDRREAIETAINLANRGDGVVVTGKGSEPFIHLADGKRTEWSDSRAVREALEK